MTKIIQSILAALILLVIFLSPSLVLAHARWVIDSVTPPRTNDTGLKTDPCGGKPRTSRSTIFSAGQTIDLEFEETINHPGHYRIAFSPANDLNFDSYVLLDNIPDTTNNGRYTREVTIPMNVCSDCTLQLIQVMTTSPTPAPGDFYYSCSDIQITAPGDTTAPSPVTNITPQQGDTQATLTWNNPVDDFYQVVILKDITPVTDTPVNGVMYAAGDMINGSEVVYAGNEASFNAASLVNDVQYYFKIFAQNPRKNYANGIETNVTPTASSSGGGNTGNTPVNTGSPDSSGGGSFNIVFLLLVLLTRVLASGNSKTLR